MFIRSAVRRHDLLLWSSGRIHHPGAASRYRWIQRDLLNIVVTAWWMITEIHKQSSLAWNGSKNSPTRNVFVSGRRWFFVLQNVHRCKTILFTFTTLRQVSSWILYSKVLSNCGIPHTTWWCFLYCNFYPPFNDCIFFSLTMAEI